MTDGSAVRGDEDPRVWFCEHFDDAAGQILAFLAGAAVTLEALNAKGLATRPGVAVKVLAKGELTKALTVHAHGFSAAAREQIEAAGGTCRLIES